MRTSVVTVLFTAKPKLRLMLPLAAVIAGAASASAYAETEPNNESGQANGPIVEDVATTGSLFSASDVDVTKLWVRKGTQVSFAYAGTNVAETQPNGVASKFDVRVVDSRGVAPLSDGAYQVGAGETGTIPMTVPTTGTYCVVVTVSPGYQTAIADPIGWSITAAAGGALLAYDPIVCDKRGADVRRIQRSLNRAQGQLISARKHGRRTSPHKRKVRALAEQRSGARAARDAACQ